MSENTKRKTRRKPTVHPYDPALARDNLIADTFKALQIPENIPVSEMPLQAMQIRGRANQAQALYMLALRLAKEVPNTDENEALLSDVNATIKAWNAKRI